MEKELLKTIGNLRLLEEKATFTFMEIMDREAFSTLDISEQKRQADLFFKLVKICSNEIGIVRDSKDDDKRNIVYRKSLYIDNKLQKDNTKVEENDKNILLKALGNINQLKSGDNFRFVDLIESSIWCSLEKQRKEWLDNSLKKIIIYVGGIRLNTISNELDINVYTII